ncbi:MAG: hypothetical protein WCL10_07755 [Novosphingobium sp.]|uniref:hypothetical protein n=1 Tax=Novosphingobium sp. TaxID=1874826 RepID=UPI003019F22D
MRKVRTLLLLAVVGTALTACGARRELLPLQGRALPPAPYGREDKPSADSLLTPPVQAKPQRNIELRSRSEDREDDPFDLPPED